jgi:hypothetical protein
MTIHQCGAERIGITAGLVLPDMPLDADIVLLFAHQFWRKNLSCGVVKSHPKLA